jgi:hypothetical protein
MTLNNVEEYELCESCPKTNIDFNETMQWFELFETLSKMNPYF